jgi:hypothetical protein
MKNFLEWYVLIGHTVLLTAALVGVFLILRSIVNSEWPDEMIYDRDY